MIIFDFRWKIFIIGCLLIFNIAQQCGYPNERCICSSSNPFCSCAYITQTQGLNYSSSYESHLVSVHNAGCQPCAPACQRCSTPSVCTECFGEFAPSSGKCNRCAINCLACPSVICTECIMGYYLNYQKKCQLCPLQGTKQCTIGSLRSCLNNYWLDHNGARCIKCDPFCSQCSSINRCSICLQGYYLNQSICNACMNQCSTCSNSKQCLTCANSMHYYNKSLGSCVNCVIDNCLLCSNSTNCQQCQSEYFLNTANSCTAITNQSRIVNCLNYSANGSSINCQACLKGYYYDKTILQCKFACSIMCEQCYGPHYGQCSKCRAQTRLINRHCIAKMNINKGSLFQLHYTVLNNPQQFRGGIILNTIQCRQEIITMGTAISLNISHLQAYKVKFQWKLYIKTDNNKNVQQQSYKILFINEKGNRSDTFNKFNCQTCDWNHCIGIHQSTYAGFISSQNQLQFRSIQGEIGLSEILITAYRCGGVQGQTCKQCTQINICTKCINPQHFIVGQFCALECPDTYYTYLVNKTCYEVCPPTTYSSDSNEQCQTCIYPCLTCNSAQQCQSCVQGFYFLLSTKKCTINCPSRYFQDKYLKICDNCVYPCLQCTSNRNCLSCAYGFLQNTSCVTKCATSYYGNLQNGSCDNCLKPCSSCGFIGSQCLSCTPGYYLDNSVCLEQCPPGYYQFNTSTNGGSCLACDEKCKNCSVIATSCTSCHIGTYLNNNICTNDCPNGTYNDKLLLLCLACANQCLTCDSISLCLSCNKSYFLFSENSSCLKQCPKMYYSSTSSCNLCELPCYTCSNVNRCLSCYDNFLWNYSCVSTCPSHTYANVTSLSCELCNITNCLECKNNPNTCTLCNSSLILILNQCQKNCSQGLYYSSLTFTCLSCQRLCLTCINSIVCLSCINNYIFQNGVCLQNCISGYFFTRNNVGQKICKICKNNCLSCINYELCSQCSNNFTLFNGSCFATCPSGLFSYNNQCFKCVLPCLQCSNEYECLSCVDNYGILFNGQCVDICPQGYYSELNGNLCKACQKSCTQCLQINSCTSCTSGYYLQLVNAKLICTTSCVQGYYSVSIDRTCKLCSQVCQSCIHTATNCTSCNYNLSLIHNSCYKQCPSRYYNDSSSSSSSSCKLCPSSCISCRSIDFCFICQQGYFRNASNQCVASCTSLQYSINSICTKCKYPCLSCKSQTICLSCIRGYLYNTQCKFACPTSTYISIGSNTSCQNCSEKCLSCNSSTNCEVCQSGVLVNGFCKDSCQIGFYGYYGVCISCIYGCSNCNNGYSCLQCSKQTVLHNGLCLQYCPLGWVANNFTCIPCVIGCQRCIISSSRCVTCTNNFLLYLESCLISCPLGSYRNQQLSQCMTCRSPCATCNNAYSCQTCIYGYIIYRQQKRNQCVKGPFCPNSYYLNLDTFECEINCLINLYIEPQKKTCSSKCPQQYVTYKQNNTCLKQCPFIQMWIDNNFICQQNNHPFQLAYLNCNNMVIRNLLIFNCYSSIILENIYSLKITNFTINNNITIEQIIILNNNQFYLITSQEINKIINSIIKIQLNYRYGLFHKIIKSQQQQYNNKNNRILSQLQLYYYYPVQNIEIQLLIQQFYYYTSTQRQIGLYMLDIAISISIGALIFWFCELIKNAKPTTLLFVTNLQWLFTLSLNNCILPPNLNQFLQGFKISCLYFFQNLIQFQSNQQINYQQSNRMKNILNFNDFTTVLLPIIIICSLFILIFIVTWICQNIFQNSSQQSAVYRFGKKCSIIKRRFYLNYPQHCCLVVSSPLALGFFKQLLHPNPIILGILSILICIDLFILAYLCYLYFQNSKQIYPSEKYFQVIALQTIIISALAIWTPRFLFLSLVLMISVINIYIWHRIFQIGQKWKQFYIELNELLKITLILMVFIGQILINYNNNSLFIYNFGWLQISIIFILLAFAATYNAMQFFYYQNFNKNIQTNKQNRKELLNNGQIQNQQQSQQYLKTNINLFFSRRNVHVDSDSSDNVANFSQEQEQEEEEEENPNIQLPISQEISINNNNISNQ